MVATYTALSTIAVLLSYFYNSNAAGYSLSKQWQGSSFFDGWYFSTTDKTGGVTDYGHYTDLAYYDSSSGAAIIKVDNKGGPTSRGRRSIKISTEEKFDEGLFILDTNRIPWGCGAWPAFWTTGSNWPEKGEIDIIEHVHNSQHTAHTLHTTDHCDYSNVNTNGQFTGSWGSNKNCYHEINHNAGCGIRAAEGTHGEAWTNGGGGVHVMLWDKNKGISIWDVPRRSVPSWLTKTTSSITDSQLQSLGTPAAKWNFGNQCTANHFYQNSIILNIAVCGDWPDGVWSSSGCASSTGKSSCHSYAWDASPSAFDNTFWSINYLKVFQYSSSVTDSSSGGDGPTDIGHFLCGYITQSCYSDLDWAVKSGIYQYSSYYPNFQYVTGKELTSATQEDMALYWYCMKRNPNGHCGGLQIPCGRACGSGSSAFQQSNGDDTGNIDPYEGKHWIWIAVEVTFSVTMVLCVVLTVFIIITKKSKQEIAKERIADVGKLGDNDQVRGSEQQERIEIDFDYRRM